MQVIFIAIDCNHTRLKPADHYSSDSRNVVRYTGQDDERPRGGYGYLAPAAEDPVWLRHCELRRRVMDWARRAARLFTKVELACSFITDLSLALIPSQFPFSPLEDDLQPNPHQVPLEIGSELYVFEVFRPSKDISYADEESLWYRGYVVASRQATPASDSKGVSSDAADRSLQPGAEEPSVTVGIFPATHCLIKERLEDTDARLEEVRQAADAFSLEKSFGLRQKTPLAPLLEEDESSQDEELLSGIVGSLQTPSKARNRASLVDERLSHHKRSESASSLGEKLHTPVVDDRPSPPLPSLKTGDETAAGLDEPLVDEIACSLRGSAGLLNTYLLQRDYAKFNAVKESIEELHLGRRQLLSGTLSTEELQQLRRSLVDKLVQVNIQQNLDIVVRHPHWGALADVDAHEAVDERAWMSAMRMYKLGVELAYTDPKSGKRPLGAHSVLGPSTNFPHPLQRTKTSQHWSNNASHASALPVFYHVLVDLKAFVASPCTPGETAELIFSLYNKSEKRFLTEECCIVLNHHGGMLLLQRKKFPAVAWLTGSFCEQYLVTADLIAPERFSRIYRSKMY